MPIPAYQTHTGMEALNGQVGRLLGARTLRELYAVGRNWVGKRLETDPSRHQVLLLLDPGEGEPCVIVIDDRSLNRNASYKLFRIPRDWPEQLSGAGGPLALERATDLPAASEVPWLTEKLGKGPGLLLPLQADGQLRGAWWAPLRAPVARGGIETIELLATMADTMGHATDRILAHERLRLHEQQVARLHQSMQDSLVATDRVSLLTQFKTILDEQFGLRRVFISLVNANANALRCELHSGFETLFIPTTIALDNEKNHFVELLRLAQVRIHESARGNFPAELSAFGEGPGAERAVLIPLCDGRRRPIGFIYADQPLHDGRPIFPEALAILARLAAASVENLELRRQAEERAETDPLTGLRNRFYMDRVLELEIPRVKRYNQPLSLLMIDLCDFKRTNDTYGHQFGDYILKETAHLIEGNVRQPDVVIRYGGDEFVVLMVNTSAEQAELVRRRIEEAFIERNRLQTDTRTMINISLGLRSADADSIASLIHDADMAMYAEKARQRRRNLITALVEGNAEKIETADRVVSSLCNMLYRKAPYYHDHALRVTHLALRIGQRTGLEGEELETLALAALLHDVGKVSIPTPILQKTEPLTHAEQLAMRNHPRLGEEFFEGLNHLEPVRPIIRSHHERYDGDMSGPYPAYPEGLVGEHIPLGGRILRLAESTDAMLFDRPYRPGLAPEEAERIIGEEAGRSFDPELARLLQEEPAWRESLGDGDGDAITELLGFDQT